VLGPGSLYTSIIPNLLIPEIVEALARNMAPHIYVCNIMTEPGETDGYTVGDHCSMPSWCNGIPPPLAP
jgi:uncharacterized cofD-like protein